jgi:hypothetical protein
MVQKPPVQELRPDQHVNPGVSDAQIDMIGRVVISFSQLEAALEDTIWFFLKLEEEDGRIVTTRLSATAKVQMLRALAPRSIADENLLVEFNKSLGLIDELKDGRNFIAHGVWGTLMPDDIPVALSLKPKSEPGEVVSETFDSEHMEAIEIGIRTMLQKLVDLPEALGEPRRVPQ